MAAVEQASACALVRPVTLQSWAARTLHSSDCALRRPAGCPDWPKFMLVQC
jgi:hypothetical protein